MKEEYGYIQLGTTVSCEIMFVIGGVRLHAQQRNF